MSTAKKFTFDTVFAAKGDVVSEAARARQKKVLTTAELDQLRAYARAEGVSSGEVQALEAIAAGALQAAETLRSVLAQSRRDLEQVRAEAVELAFTVARALARSAVAALPVADVEQALRASLHQAIGEPRVVLRASPQVAEALAPRIADIAHEEGFDGRVQVIAEPHLQGADCRIEWRGGGTERSEAALEEAVGELITRRFSNAEHTTEE
jgi:flagellar assembly protein FliH